jgi:hypothetical protein
MSHLWQRFLLASALVFGVLLGVAATVFGYSNNSAVDVRWAIFHIDGVPLWTVTIIPLAVVLVAGTIYHWLNSLHHFTEHMRHRRRVHELEAEVATLREHLDHVLEMPDQSSSRLPAKHITAEAAPAEPVASPTPALPEPAAPNGESRVHRRTGARKRVTLTTASEPEAAVTTEPVAAAKSSEPGEPTPAVEDAPAAPAQPAAEA